LASLAAAVVAACGGSSPPEAAPAVPGGSASGSSSQATGHCPDSAGLSGAVDDHGTSGATGSTIAIGAADSYFEPTCVTAVPPGTVTLTLKNTGSLVHNISIPDQGLDTDLPMGQTVTVHVMVGSAPLHYFCKYHRTSGMVAALVPAGR